MWYSKTNHNGVDIWPWYDNVQGDIVYIAKDYYVPRYDVPRSLVFPLKPVNFEGFDTFVPGDPEGYVEWQYGKDWRTEKNCTVVNDSNCVV